ncbi:MAG: hypothetical protein RLZZ432_172 [Chloroflexota bacterium]|jgi:UDP-GlcNAc:undecaprenyl-phosphate GlcNAc-1-phosphate transferase
MATPPLAAVLVAAVLAAALLSLAGTAMMRRIALRYGIADAPNERRINTVAVPRAGGFAIALSFAAVGALLVALAEPLGLDVGTGVARLRESGAPALLLGVLAAAGIGLLDDRFDLRARWQLVGQVAVALIPIAFGLRILFVALPFGSGLLLFSDTVGVAVTIVWILGMQNAMNFIDGLDGLSGGIALIAALTLGLLAVESTPLLAALCFALVGAIAGFLRFNVHPASIYMGTSGIQSVALALAILALLGVAKVAAALLILGIPVIDAFFVIAGRVAAGRSPYSADRSHIHQRLLDAGLGHRDTVTLLWGATALLALAALLLPERVTLAAFAALLVALGGTIAWLQRNRRRTGGAGR